MKIYFNEFQTQSWLSTMLCLCMLQPSVLILNFATLIMSPNKTYHNDRKIPQSPPLYISTLPPSILFISWSFN